MLRTLRRSTSAPALRRLLAVLVALCVGVAFAEPMIEDGCDDAESRSAIAALAGDAGTASLVDGVRAEGPQQDAPASDQHTMHVCHCAHAHVGTLAAAHTIPDDVQVVLDITVSHAAQIPPTVSGEPQLRPPRVLTA